MKFELLDIIFELITIAIIIISAKLLIGMIMVWVKNKQSRKLKNFLKMVVVVVLCIACVIGVQYAEKLYNNSFRYETIEEMTKEVFPGKEIDTILYDEDCAVVMFSYDNDGVYQWYGVSKDESGWRKASEITNDSYKLIDDYDKRNIYIIYNINDEGIDFICYNENAFLHYFYEEELGSFDPTISDNIDSVFKQCELKDGLEMYYTFADIENNNYTLYIDGAPLEVNTY